MDSLRCDLIEWSEFIKVTKFAEKIGVSKVAVSNYIKHGTKSISDLKIQELHDLILSYMRNNFA